MWICCVCVGALVSVSCGGTDSTSPQGASLTGYWCDANEVGPSALVLTQTGSAVSGKVANYYWYSSADTSYVTGTGPDLAISACANRYP